MNARDKAAPGSGRIGGLAGWLLGRFRSGGRSRPRLELLERIALAPRQSLALVEAEGRRFLVATSPEGAPAFYALDNGSSPIRLSTSRPSSVQSSSARLRPGVDNAARVPVAARVAERVSW